MAKVRPKPTGKVRWSDETIRRRGVRAVVAALRLKKECELLRREHAIYLGEVMIGRRQLEDARTLNKFLRELRKRQETHTVRINGNGNSWSNHKHSQPKAVDI